MDLSAVGIYENGSEPRASFLPENPRVALSIVQGATVLLTLTAYTVDGVLLDTSPWTFYWAIRRTRTDAIALKRAGTPVPYKGAGRVEFFLTASETARMKPGAHAYDIWMEAGGDFEPLIPFSPFQVEPSIYPTSLGAVTPNPGPPPGPVAGARIWNEVPAGAIPGTVFVTVQKYVPGDEHVFLNGVLQRAGLGSDYVRSESGGIGSGYDTFTFTYSTKSGDQVTVDYNPSA